MAWACESTNLHTGRLEDRLVTSDLASPTTIDEHAYSYNPSGNPTKDVETRRSSTSTAETQCYAYTPLDQLASAWTATDGRAAVPTSSAHSQVGDPLGSGSAYWTSWTYNAGGVQPGQLAMQVVHAVGRGGRHLLR